MCAPTAQLYGKIAPGALHMPSHIYSILGMWEDSVRSNLASKTSADDYEAKNFPDTTHPGVPHMSDFLVYAYLQTARDGEAKQLVDALPKLKKFRFASLGIDTALAAIPARFALERGRWDEAAPLPVRDSQFPAAQSISHFARSLGNARLGSAPAARAEIAYLDEQEAKLAAAKDDYWAGQTRIQKQAAAAWVMFAEGDRNAAIAGAARAARESGSVEAAKRYYRALTDGAGGRRRGEPARSLRGEDLPRAKLKGPTSGPANRAKSAQRGA